MMGSREEKANIMKSFAFKFICRTQTIWTAMPKMQASVTMSSELIACHLGHCFNQCFSGYLTTSRLTLLVHSWGLVKYCTGLQGTTVRMIAKTAQMNEAATTA
jgi:hypothetical protein